MCATGVSLIARGLLSGDTPRGQLWTSAVTLPQGRNGLRAWRMAVLSTFREQGHPGDRTREEEKRPKRFTFLVLRCPPAESIFAS